MLSMLTDFLQFCARFSEILSLERSATNSSGLCDDELILTAFEKKALT